MMINELLSLADNDDTLMCTAIEFHVAKDFLVDFILRRFAIQLIRFCSSEKENFFQLDQIQIGSLIEFFNLRYVVSEQIMDIHLF